MRASVDPVTLEVIRNALTAIAEEMSRVLGARAGGLRHAAEEAHAEAAAHTRPENLLRRIRAFFGLNAAA